MCGIVPSRYHFRRIRTSYLSRPIAFAQERMPPMTVHLGLAPLVSLIAGILILIMPRLLNFIVALYLIVIGVIGLVGAGNFHF